MRTIVTKDGMEIGVVEKVNLYSCDNNEAIKAYLATRDGLNAYFNTFEEAVSGLEYRNRVDN